MDLAKVAAALADPVRIAILNLMSGPPGQCPGCKTDGVCVCEFSQHLHLSQPRVSYHLRILREAGLVTERPQGKWTYYSVARERIQAFCDGLMSTTGALKPGGRQSE